MDKIGNAKRKPVSNYIEQLHKIHPNIDLNGDYISGNIPTPHICRNCGFEWDPYPINLLHGASCPICEKVFSRGERKIIAILDSHNIDYHSQFRFNDCRNKNPLPFDFYIPHTNTCIEFQGKQHYEVAQFGGMDYEIASKQLSELKQRDLIKFNYCKNNSINLIVIPYWDFNNIEEILKDKKVIA